MIKIKAQYDIVLLKEKTVSSFPYKLHSFLLKLGKLHLHSTEDV